MLKCSIAKMLENEKKNSVLVVNTIRFSGASELAGATTLNNTLKAPSPSHKPSSEKQELRLNISVHLKEEDVVRRAGQLLQLTIGPPDLHHLSLDLVQQLLGLRDSRPLLVAEQLRHFSALFLNGADQPGENPLALLHRRLRRVLCRGRWWEVVAAIKPLWEEKTYRPWCIGPHIWVLSPHPSVSGWTSKRRLGAFSKGIYKKNIRQGSQVAHSFPPHLTFKTESFVFCGPRLGLNTSRSLTDRPRLLTWTSEHSWQPQQHGSFHALHWMFERARPFHQTIKIPSFILVNRWTKQACLSTCSAVCRVQGGDRITSKSWFEQEKTPHHIFQNIQQWDFI